MRVLLAIAVLLWSAHYASMVFDVTHLCESYVIVQCVCVAGLRHIIIIQAAIISSQAAIVPIIVAI